jgi:integrase
VQRGSLKVIKNRRGERVWRLQWRENGRGRTRILGRYADMSRAEADAERQKILAPLNAKTEVAPTSAVTLRRYVEDEYLTLKTRIWKASTRATTEQIVEAHILSELGSRPLASITRKELQALLDAKAESSLSFSVVGHVRWQLAAIFGMAKSDGLTSVNPAEELVIPKCKEPGEKRTIAADSIGKAEMVLAIRERLVFHFAVYQGMRPGEIVGLQLGDFRDGMIHVARRIYRTVVDTEVLEVPPGNTADGSNGTAVEAVAGTANGSAARSVAVPLRGWQHTFELFEPLSPQHSAGARKGGTRQSQFPSATANVGDAVQRRGEGSGRPGATRRAQC